MAAALVVDDDPVSRRVVAHLLERLGHTPMTAADGPSALALLASFRPAVACVDLHLPGMSGLELIARMRAALGERMPRVVMLTASADAGDRLRADGAGVDRYLTKPVGSTAMAEIIEPLFLDAGPAGVPAHGAAR
ncbi:MAG: response regulator [Chloroflexota bacterium]